MSHSDTPPRLRRCFEVDAECMVVATLWALAKQGKIKPAFVQKAMSDLGVAPEKTHAEIV